MVKCCLFENGASRIIELSKAQVPALDAAYLFGDGVYEVVAVVNGHLFDLEPHLDRLEASLRTVLIAAPMGRNKLTDELHNLLKENNVSEKSNGYIYLQITRGAHDKRDFAIANETKPAMFAYYQDQKLYPAQGDGETSIIFPDIRWQLRHVKTTQLMASRLAKKFATDAQAMEPIYISRDGTVTEGGSSNIFIVKDGKISTHPADNDILSGITRSRVIELADNVIECKFTIDELLAADEVFRTSTTQGVRAVTSIKISNAQAETFADVPPQSIWRPAQKHLGAHKIGTGKVGEITKALAAKYIELATSSSHENFSKTA